MLDFRTSHYILILGFSIKMSISEFLDKLKDHLVGVRHDGLLEICGIRISHILVNLEILNNFPPLKFYSIFTIHLVTYLLFFMTVCYNMLKIHVHQLDLFSTPNIRLIRKYASLSDIHLHIGFFLDKQAYGININYAWHGCCT